MVDFKSFNNIVLDMIQSLRLTQPALDTKPNTVARDLFVDTQALQLANIYEAMREVAALQSIANLTGQDLVNYGANFGVEKRSGTKSIGTVVFTFRSLDSDITIEEGTVVRSRGGIPFLTVSSANALVSQSNALRATATRLRNQLDTAGITDEFALEVSVESQSSGSSGNISQYSIVSHSAAGVNSVTNVTSFSGGTDSETDAAFRSRILSVFAGANTGTALGYRSIVLGLADAIDALVIEPGSTLMTRDGTIVVTDDDGNTVVSEPGTGGRVDIYVLGENPQSGTDSFVYNDQSGETDPTDDSNNYILGQSSLTADASLTLNLRRVTTLSGTSDIPLQPVTSIVSVSGSSSGPNFIEEFLDTDGNLKGNYRLEKDSGSASGSPFGLDKMVWISDRIDLESESRTKGSLNSVDELAFTDVLEIYASSQDIQVTNENSTVSSSRNSITTLHSPVRTVSRVFNLTTGERYTITDQNPDGDGNINGTGRVLISGRTLPTVSDILQVDYTWVYDFDSGIDFDHLNPQDSLNSSQDSIDWGYSNYIRDEPSTAVLDAYSNLHVQTNYFISKVISVNTFVSETSVITGTTTGKTIVTNNPVSNIHSIIDTSISGSPEIYNTKESDGVFSNLLISLPSDTVAQVGDTVTITYNLNDIFNIDGYDSGTYANKLITLNPNTATSTGTSVLVNYVTELENLIPQTDISSLSISSNGLNGFVEVDGYQPVLNRFSGPSNTIIDNQRRSPSKLRVNVSNIPNNGVIRVVGTTINKIDSTYISTSSSSINFASLIREAEGLSEIATVPNTIYIAKVVKLQQVTLSDNGEIQSVDLEYDLTNYKIGDSSWDIANSLEDISINNTSMVLSGVSANTSSLILTGTVVRVIFYYAKLNDYEDLFFSRNGIMTTNKTFGHIDSLNRFSGFQDSGGTISGKVLVDSFNQPAENSSYFVDYSYTAPKENERITVNFEYNKLIVDATEAIEDNRPITADVLVKSAVEVELDVDAYIVVEEEFADREATVKQDVADNITATLNSSALGTTLDQSDIVANVYNVEGLDRIRITRFNLANISGTKTSITAEDNEYLSPGSVTVEVESR